jgi:hypothetical protein
MANDGNVVLINWCFLILATFLDIIGMLLWARRIPPNKFIGVRVGDNNRGINFEFKF